MDKEGITIMKKRTKPQSSKKESPSIIFQARPKAKPQAKAKPKAKSHSSN